MFWKLFKKYTKTDPIKSIAQWFSNFHEPWPPSKGSSEYLIYCDTWVMQWISWQSYLMKASACGPQKPLHSHQGILRTLFEKPWYRFYHQNKSLNGEIWTENHSHSRRKHFPLTTKTVLVVWQTQCFIWAMPSLADL